MRSNSAEETSAMSAEETSAVPAEEFDSDVPRIKDEKVVSFEPSVPGSSLVSTTAVNSGLSSMRPTIVSGVPSAVDDNKVTSSELRVASTGGGGGGTSPPVIRSWIHAAAVSAVRVRCAVPLRKLSAAVLSATVSGGGSLQVRTEGLKLDLPLQRIRLAPDRGENGGNLF